MALLAARPGRGLEGLEAGVAFTRDGRLDELDLGVGEEDRLRLDRLARGRPSELAPVGGAMVMTRVFSEPALMNGVGRSGASAGEAKNRTAATATRRAWSSDCGARTGWRACRR